MKTAMQVEPETKVQTRHIVSTYLDALSTVLDGIVDSRQACNFSVCLINHDTSEIRYLVVEGAQGRHRITTAYDKMRIT